MHIIINNSSMVPIYEQIIDQIKSAIIRGELIISFKDGDFGKYKTSMYDVICDIMKSSNLFCRE